MSNSSVWPINRTLSGGTISGQCGFGSDENEVLLRISQSFSISRVFAFSLFCAILWTLIRGHLIDLQRYRWCILLLKSTALVLSFNEITLLFLAIDMSKAKVFHWPLKYDHGHSVYYFVQVKPHLNLIETNYGPYGYGWYALISTKVGLQNLF